MKYCKFIMALFKKMDSRKEVKLQVLLENLQVLLESDIILIVGKYSVLGNFSSRNAFSKIVALIV